MPEIIIAPDEWIDVDLPESLEEGNDTLPDSQSKVAPASFSIPKYGGTTYSIEQIRSYASGTDFRQRGLWINNQSSWPSCVSNATCASCEGAFYTILPTEFVPKLSCGVLYTRVGNSRSGSTLRDNLYEMQSRGTVLEDCQRNRDILAKLQPYLDIEFLLCPPESRYSYNDTTNWMRRNDWERTAEHFKIEEFGETSGYRANISACCDGFRPVYARSGHSIVMYGYAQDSRGKNLAMYKNSWSPNWGDEGYGYDSERAGSGGTFFARSFQKSKYIQAVMAYSNDNRAA